MPSTIVDDLARQLNVSSERVVQLIDQTSASLPEQTYYVFRTTGEQAKTGARSDQARTIAAFPTPDDALSFSQRNGYAVSPQIRPVSSRDLLQLLLRDPSIKAVRFLRSVSSDKTTRGFPPGLTIERKQFLDQLASNVLNPIDLTAKAFDALRFGVDFGRRGAFRAALTEALEEIVAAYVPPEGSLDTGPRSVYATAVVELWLRQHGFPHAHQRRWVQIADELGWHGADELYEIDCGTRQRLLVQLLIHNKDERQYIGRVIVTS